MPAPKALAGLPKPVLFGLYGAVGGLLGALVFAEPLYRVLTPPPPPPASTAQVALAASREVEVFSDGRNTFPVQVARDGFDGPVTVRLDGLPRGVTAAPVVIPEGKTEGEVLVIGSSTVEVATTQVKAVATAVSSAGGMAPTADVPITLKASRPPRPLADIVFVLDVTSSMQWAIDDLKNGIGKFADALGQARIDFRLGLVTFQDVTIPGEKVEVVLFKGGPFTTDPATFSDKVAELKASGGGDIPESSLEGVEAACGMPFRPDATKVLLFVTDAPPKVIRGGGVDAVVGQAAKRIKAAGIDSVHIVVQRFDQDTYRPLSAAGTGKTGGKYFNLGDVVRGDDGFDGLLATFGTAVTAAAVAKNPDTKPRVPDRAGRPVLGVKSLQSGEQSAAGTEGRLVLRSAAWTAAIAALVCLFLLSGQYHYLRGSLPAAGGAAVGLLGGFGVGLVGGAAGQGLFFLAPDSATLAHIFRVFGWALLGGLAGVGLAAFIPNMRWPLGLAGGAAGGAAGAVGFIAVSAATGDLVGRLVGGLVLGFCIGLMVAVAEAVRSAWLEVRYGSGETIRVTLGAVPVAVGGDSRACTVWARGAPAVAVKFFVRDGKVVCDDLVLPRETVVSAGYVKDVGNVTLTVFTGRGTAPAAPRPATPPTAAKGTVQKPLDLDDDFDWPQANVPAPPPARPAAAKPVPQPAPRPAPPPVAPPPPKPVPPPAAPPAAKNPNACPGCGRVASGAAGKRYCMVCDMTY